MSLRTSILMSLLAHALLLIAISTQVTEDGGGGHPEDDGSRTIYVSVDEPKERVEGDEAGDIVIRSGEAKECKDTYVGVGYIRGSTEHEGGHICLVLEVAPGGPADRAGIRPGDKLIGINDDAFCPGRGEEGTTVEAYVIRDNHTQFRVSMVREKICWN